jgi:hypothetical protein
MANTAHILDYKQLAGAASDLLSLRNEPKFQPLCLPTLMSLLPNGLSRGAITEVNGRRSSGRTSVFIHILAEATTRGEICALIDLRNSFDPNSAAKAGVQLNRLVWVRCQGNPEHAMRAADLILHAGGFGVVLLDLCEAGARILNRIPLSYWYRFRRAIDSTSTILVVCAETPQARCSQSTVNVEQSRSHWSGQSPFLLLEKLDVQARLKTTAASSKPVWLRTVA